jgi:hypothetical protein
MNLYQAIEFIPPLALAKYPVAYGQFRTGLAEFGGRNNLKKYGEAVYNILGAPMSISTGRMTNAIQKNARIRAPRKLCTAIPSRNSYPIMTSNSRGTYLDHAER